jgi:hypothetical protein
MEERVASTSSAEKIREREKCLTLTRSLIFPNLKTEAIRSSETSVFTRSTWCHIPEVGILSTKYKSPFYVTLYFPQVSFLLGTV